MKRHINIDQLLELSDDHIVRATDYFKMLHDDNSLFDNINILDTIKTYREKRELHLLTYKETNDLYLLLMKLIELMDVTHMIEYLERSRFVTITKTGINESVKWYVMVECETKGSFVKEDIALVDVLWECVKECVRLNMLYELDKTLGVNVVQLIRNKSN